jgi:phage/plasmid-associated DNA primase
MNPAEESLRTCLLWSGRSGGLEDVYDVLYEYDKVTTTLKWTFNQGDGKETSTFELNTTTLKARLQLCDNAEEIFVHGEKGLPVLTELAGVHQGIGQGLSWTVTRPTDDLMSFAATNRKIDVYNMDTPKNSTAILSWPLTPGMKSVNLKKSVIPTLKHAHDKAVKDAAMSRFGLDRLVIIGNNNNILIVNNKAADDDKKRTIDRAFYPVLKEGGVLDDLVAISDDRFYVWSSSTGLWNAGSINMAACHIRAAAADEDTDSFNDFRATLSYTDMSYLASCEGPIKVLRSIISRVLDAKFPQRLNNVPDGMVAFQNGMYDVRNGQFRPFSKADYISETIGYDYVPRSAIPEEDFEFLSDFYTKAFPLEEERRYFQRAIGKSLASKTVGKYFLILSDQRDGSNLKTSIMRSVEEAFGSYKAIAERDFLYESSSTSSSSSNPNFLAYAGKKLAFFDEPSSNEGHSQKRLDLMKIKDLTSGAAQIRGRMNHANVMEESPFNCLIVLSCNESSFPKINATDMAFVKRMKPIKMRSLFVSNEEHAAMIANGDEYVYVKDESIDYKSIYVRTRMAHAHLLMDAYLDVVALAGSLGPEPPCVVEMLDAIIKDSDPRMQKVKEFVDKHVDFNPTRPDDRKGCMIYAWIIGKDLYNAFWKWYVAEQRSEFRKDVSNRAMDTKTEWFKVVNAVMKKAGREYKLLKPIVNGTQLEFKGFDRVSLIDPDA